MPTFENPRVTTPRDRELDTKRGDTIDLRSGETHRGLAERAATAVERTRRARLARWQQATGNERDGVGRSRQTPASRAQDARSAPGSHNSSPA